MKLNLKLLPVLFFGLTTLTTAQEIKTELNKEIGGRDKEPQLAGADLTHLMQQPRQNLDLDHTPQILLLLPRGNDAPGR